jgi:hypothetical protein
MTSKTDKNAGGGQIVLAHGISTERSKLVAGCNLAGLHQHHYWVLHRVGETP